MVQIALLLVAGTEYHDPRNLLFLIHRYVTEEKDGKRGKVKPLIMLED